VPRRAADRIVAALTADQAVAALVAGGRILVQTQNRPSRAMPSSAPRGHSARHQKRVTRRFIASSARKATPSHYAQPVMGLIDDIVTSCWPRQAE
jgi:hypothetical protein